MNLLVTGATGFVGARLIKQAALLHPDWNIYILVRENSVQSRLLNIHPYPHVLVGDITDKKSLSAAVLKSKPDIIYHFANAGVYAGQSIVDEDSFKINALGLLNLFEATRQYPYTHFINIGSSSEYGIKYAPMSVTDVCEPQNAYGISKLTATLLARLEHQIHGRSVATFRLFSPYGPQDDSQRLIMRAIDCCLNKKSFNLPDRSVRRDYIFVDDVVELLLFAGTQTKPYLGDVFNVGSGTESLPIEIVQTIGELTDSTEWILSLQNTVNPIGKAESPTWVADMSKTFLNFPWRPQTSLGKGLSETIEFVRNNGESQTI